MRDLEEPEEDQSVHHWPLWPIIIIVVILEGTLTSHSKVYFVEWMEKDGKEMNKYASFLYWGLSYVNF